MEGGFASVLHLGYRHHGLSPIDVFHGFADSGNVVPFNARRYRNFLLACGLVTQEQVIRESALAFGGTMKE